MTLRFGASAESVAQDLAEQQRVNRLFAALQPNPGTLEPIVGRQKKPG